VETKNLAQKIAYIKATTAMAYLQATVWTEVTVFGTNIKVMIIDVVGAVLCAILVKKNKLVLRKHMEVVITSMGLNMRLFATRN
jgi:hypothetical protein